jgi:phytoene dehydrogenase-like protein
MTPASFAEAAFRSQAAQRIIPGLALHADLGPDDLMGAAVGMTLALLATRSGFAVPVGGAQAITEALLLRLREAGGAVRSGARVAKVIVRERAVAAVRLADGEEIACRAVLADTGAPALCLNLVGDEHLPAGLIRSMRSFRYAWGTFKLDLALDGEVPWLAPAARQTAVVHVSGASMGSLRSFTSEIRDGRLASEPYALVGQQSLLDPSRAPPGKHTLYVYTHAPAALPGGWGAHREAFADRVEEWIEACAPGFRSRVRSRHILSPVDLEAMNENLVGGDLGGGTAHLERQLFWRPAFPYFSYRMPLKGLYLGSASTHPGTGVHGACGYNAARALLADRGLTPAPLPSTSSLA